MIIIPIIDKAVKSISKLHIFGISCCDGRNIETKDYVLMKTKLF